VIDAAAFEVAPTPTFTAGIDLWIKPVSFLIASLSLRTDLDYLKLHALWPHQSPFPFSDPSICHFGQSYNSPMLWLCGFAPPYSSS
jgi:hypothetical protein